MHENNDEGKKKNAFSRLQWEAAEELNPDDFQEEGVGETNL